MRTTVLTAFTLIAFAANSLLCRMALGGNLIDPVSFTAFRLISGVAILLPIAHLSARRMARPPQRRGSWGSGLALFAYAFAFSLAYLTLDTGMGALILFGAVQATMLAAGLRSGERPHPAQWLGLAAAGRPAAARGRAPRGSARPRSSARRPCRSRRAGPPPRAGRAGSGRARRRPRRAAAARRARPT